MMKSRQVCAKSSRWWPVVLVALAAVAALAVLPGPVSAQSNDTGADPRPPGGTSGPGSKNTGRRYDLVSGPDLKRLLRKLGYTARLYRDKKGAPKIESRLEGTRVLIGFYACTKAAQPRCQSIQIYSGYQMRAPVSYAKLNAWNGARRYARAYRQQDNPKVVFLELDMPFQGVSDLTFRKQLDMFRRLNALFRKHIGYRK